MIAGLSKRIASFFVRNEVIKSEDEDVYEYGLQRRRLGNRMEIYRVVSIICAFSAFLLSGCSNLNESDVHHSDAFIASSEGVSVTTEYDNEKTSAVQSSSCTYSSTVMNKINSENVSVTTEHIEENTSTNQTLPYDANDDSSINTDNLCATIVCNYPYSQKEYSYYILCVSLNGDVWGTTYSLNADGSDVNIFFTSYIPAMSLYGLLLQKQIILGNWN